MANTFTTSAVLNHTTVAGFNAWVTEVIGAMFTNLTLTQTADTGQTTNGGSSVPAVNTAGGYVIGRFNDTLQSTAPIFFKLEFGTGSVITQPQMWLTVGQGSNGSGTLTGTLTTRCAVLTGSAPSSTTTSFVSRYCYNATAGIFWFGFKYASQGVSNCTIGGLVITRDSTNTGASAGNAAISITNSNTSTSVASSSGEAQIYSYSTSSLVTLGNSIPWSQWYFGLNSTNVGTQVQVSPCVFPAPILFVSANMAIGLIAEEPLGNTASVALVGSTPVTLISAGVPFGSNNNVATLAGVTAAPAGGLTLDILWQ
jgi:hypothetical protein